MREFLARRRQMGTCARTRHLRLQQSLYSRTRRIVLEQLEDRHLLSAVTPLSGLSADVRQHRADSLIVQFRDGVSTPGSLRASLATAKVNADWALTPGMRTVDVKPGSNWEDALAAFKSDPNVLFAEPDYHVSLQRAPDDPDFDKTWGLDNTGQTGGVEDADIDAVEAWDVTQGSRDTIVAVIDTGVDYTHPDLAANIWTNPGEIPGNGRDDDNNGYVDDFHGYDFANDDGDPMDDHFHGTHVAGTIGAVGNDGYGITGVNWHVQIMALKFLAADGGGYTSDAIAALNYAVANGAVVSNNSWGGGGFSAAFQTALLNAKAKDHIFVAAAGNDGWNNDLDPFYPAGYKSPSVNNIIAVAATDSSDQLAWFSNYGKKTVDLAAPGVDIYSTFPMQVTPAMRDDGFAAEYGSISGTSMATPHVTGVVALVRSQHPEWSYEEVIDQVLGAVDEVDGAAQTITGGRLNAAAAVGNSAPDTFGPRVVSSDPTGIATGTVNHVRIRFNEAIDLATIGVNNISVTDPAGAAVDVSGMVPVTGGRQFDFTFAIPQTALGSYSLTVGGSITDLTGNPFDQDRDGIGGEDPDDTYTATFEIAAIAAFHSTDVPAPVADLFTVSSYLTVGPDLTIGDLNVQLDITYPYDGNLSIYLESPSGTVVSLYAYEQVPDGDFSNTLFDDEADTPISFGYAPYAGSFQPLESLAAFDGENAAGTWTLSIDGLPFWGFGDGYLNAWSIQIEGSGGGGGDPPPPPPPPPGNRAPVAGNDTLEGEVNTRLSVAAATLLANDTDPDGDQLSITFVGNPTGGAVSLNQDQLITFTPTDDFQGTATFQYILTDGFLMTTGNVSINVQPLFQWHNTAIAQDVNKNGSVEAADALVVINEINAHGSSPLERLSASGEPEWFIDVSADNVVAPNDALIVINYINDHRQPGGMSAGEGESSASSHDAALLSLLTGDDSELFGPTGRRRA